MHQTKAQILFWGEILTKSNTELIALFTHAFLPAAQDSRSRTRSLLHKAFSGPARSCNQGISGSGWQSVGKLGPKAPSSVHVQPIGKNLDAESVRPVTIQAASADPVNAGLANPSTAVQVAPAFTSQPQLARDQITPAAPAPIGFSRVPSADLGFTFTRACSFETEPVQLAVPATSTELQPTLLLDGVDAGLRAAFIKHFRRATTRATLLDGAELLREAMADCSEGGTFQTSMPMYSIYCTRWAPPFHIALALTSLNKLVGCINLLVQNRKCKGQHFRFTPLERRGPSGSELWTATTGPGIADFGLLLHGCGIGGANMSTVGDSVVASFPEPVGMNGWWLSTAFQATALDPVRFVLEGSRDGANWELCGASRFTAVPSLKDVALIGWQAAAYNTTHVRGAVEVFGLEVPWQFAVDHMLIMLTHTVTNSWAFIAHILRYPIQCHRAMQLSNIIGSRVYLISAFCYALQGNWTVAAIPAMYSLLFFTTSYTYCKMDSVARFQAHASAGFAAAGIVQYLVVFGNSDGTRVIFDGYRTVLPLDVKTAFATSFIFFCIYLWAESGVARSIADARAVIAADEQEYDAAWAACIASRTDSSALEDIDMLMHATWGHLRPGILRQCDRRSGYCKPIKSLERILAQASVAAPLLRSKVKAWALKSGGSFPVQHHDDGESRFDGRGPQSVRFERWERIAGDPELMGRVKWARVKSEKRMVEKVYRCYAGDVSRLVDCCRCDMTASLSMPWLTGQSDASLG
jgi:hypothetical protein